MKVREVIKRLKADGWYEDRMRGSHRVLKHPSKFGIVVIPGNFGMMQPLAHLKVFGNKQNWRIKNERILCNF